MPDREYITHYHPGSKRPTRVLAETTGKRIPEALEEVYDTTEAASVTHNRTVVERTPEGFTTPQRRVVSDADEADVELFGRENPWGNQHPAEGIDPDREWETVEMPGSDRGTRLLVEAWGATLSDERKGSIAGQSPKPTVAPEDPEGGDD
jgi:hypothetical protein